MKLEKKHWIIIGVVIALIAIWYFFLRKKKTESGFRAGGVSGCPSGEYICGVIGKGDTARVQCCKASKDGADVKTGAGVNI